MSNSLLFSEPLYLPSVNSNIVYSKPGESSSTKLEDTPYYPHGRLFPYAYDRLTPQISTGFSFSTSLPSSPATPESAGFIGHHFEVFDVAQTQYFNDNSTVISPSTREQPIDTDCSALLDRWDPIPSYTLQNKRDACGPTAAEPEPLHIAINIAVERIWRVGSPVDAEAALSTLAQLYDESNRDQDFLLILKEQGTKAFKQTWLNVSKPNIPASASADRPD